MTIPSDFQFTTISPLIMGIVQIVLTAAIFTFRHIEVHKILGEANLPRRYSSLFWVSRIFTLVSFMAFFLLLVVFLSLPA